MQEMDQTEKMTHAGSRNPLRIERDLLEKFVLSFIYYYYERWYLNPLELENLYSNLSQIDRIEGPFESVDPNPAMGAECQAKIKKMGSTDGQVTVLSVDFQKINLPQKEGLLVSVCGEITPNNSLHPVPRRFMQTFVLVKGEFWCIHNDIFRFFPSEQPPPAQPQPPVFSAEVPRHAAAVTHQQGRGQNGGANQRNPQRQPPSDHNDRSMQMTHVSSGAQGVHQMVDQQLGQSLGNQPQPTARDSGGMQTKGGAPGLVLSNENMLSRDSGNQMSGGVGPGRAMQPTNSLPTQGHEAMPGRQTPSQGQPDPRGGPPPFGGGGPPPTGPTALPGGTPNRPEAQMTGQQGGAPGLEPRSHGMMHESQPSRAPAPSATGPPSGNQGGPPVERQPSPQPADQQHLRDQQGMPPDGSGQPPRPVGAGGAGAAAGKQLAGGQQGAGAPAAAGGATPTNPAGPETPLKPAKTTSGTWAQLCMQNSGKSTTARPTKVTPMARPATSSSPMKGGGRGTTAGRGMAAHSSPDRGGDRPGGNRGNRDRQQKNKRNRKLYGVFFSPLTTGPDAFVGQQVGDYEVRQAFSAFGQVAKVDFRNKYGFVYYETQEGMERACRESRVAVKTIPVRIEEKRNRPPRGENWTRGNRGGRGGGKRGGRK